MFDHKGQVRQILKSSTWRKIVVELQPEDGGEKASQTELNDSVRQNNLR